MRFKLGLGIGFAAGYYLGTAAGEERHRQLQQWLDKVGHSDIVDAATDKAKAVVDLGVERARDLVDAQRGGNGHQDATQDI